MISKVMFAFADRRGGPCTPPVSRCPIQGASVWVEACLLADRQSSLLSSVPAAFECGKKRCRVPLTIMLIAVQRSGTRRVFMCIFYMFGKSP